MSKLNERITNILSKKAKKYYLEVVNEEDTSDECNTDNSKSEFSSDEDHLSFNDIVSNEVSTFNNLLFY